MSLFENPAYRWRETFFVLFDAQHRPNVEQLREELEDLGGHLEVEDIRGDDDGRIDSMTIYSPEDFAAMDVSYTMGEEVAEQVPELVSELEPMADTDDERRKIAQLNACTARLDVYHFERRSDAADEEDEFMDPGGLLVVLERLGQICHGIVVDPQSGGLL